MMIVKQFPGCTEASAKSSLEEVPALMLELRDINIFFWTDAALIVTIVAIFANPDKIIRRLRGLVTRWAC